MRYQHHVGGFTPHAGQGELLREGTWPPCFSNNHPAGVDDACPPCSEAAALHQGIQPSAVQAAMAGVGVEVGETSGVTLFTCLSVHWAESMVATRVS